jgi:alpha-1,2-mannosyltransferase
VRAADRWWEILRPAVAGLAAAILIALIAGVLAGQLGVWRRAVDRDAQDFGIFLSSARHDLAGRSLYAPTRVGLWPSGYTTEVMNLNLPHTMLLVWPLARLADRTALAVWLTLGLVLGAWASLASVRALGWRVRLLPLLIIVVYLLAWAPSAAFTMTAQISFFVMAPVCAAWLACRRGASTRAGIWLGLAAAMKPFLLLFLPYFLLRRDRQAVQAMVGVLAVCVTVGLAVFGARAYADWLAQLPRITWSAHFLNASVMGVVQRTMGRSGFALITRAPALVVPVTACLALVIGALTLRRVSRERPEPARTDGDFAVLLLAALLMSPLGWNYYLWIAVWPVAAVLARHAPWRRPALHDLWLVPGLGGWLWWGRMTSWGQPHALGTLTAASLYFWALLSLWIWTLGALRRAS